MSCSLRHQEYKPLSASAMRSILAFDAERGFGIGGTEPNRNRFYHYLTQSGSDVQIRTVAVKAAKRTETPMVKEVVRASVDDPWIHVIDLGFLAIAGYIVDWTRDFDDSKPLSWTYGRRWEAAPYALRCMWKVNAPVVNPELLTRTRRFRWSAWAPERSHLLDYLKVYKEHPEIELLSKCGLGKFCTKISIVRKLKADRNFRQFFMKNAEDLRQCGVDTIFLAYKKEISLGAAWNEMQIIKSFRGKGLPRAVSAVKAVGYIIAAKIQRNEYTGYLINCQKAGMDLADTKVAFPKQFKARNQIVQDMADAIRRQEQIIHDRAEALLRKEARAKINRQLTAIAEKWSCLERTGRDYRIVIPRTEQDFIDAGRAMANCLGQYAARVSRGELVVVFVRQAGHPRKAFVAAAYDPKTETVTQCYGVKNSKPPKPVTDFVQRVFAGISSKKQLKVAA